MIERPPDSGSLLAGGPIDGEGALGPTVGELLEPPEPLDEPPEEPPGKPEEPPDEFGFLTTTEFVP